MINVEVATILHFTQVIYQITRHSVLSDMYIWNIVSWQLEHIHSRLNTYHLMGKVDYNNHYGIICLFVWFCFCLFFFLFVFILFVCFFQFVYFLMRCLPHCVIQFKSVSNDLRIHWIPSSLVNFFRHDQCHVFFFITCIRVPPKNCICVYTDTIRYFSYGYHPFLFIWIPSVSFVITGFHPFLNRF